MELPNLELLETNAGKRFGFQLEITRPLYQGLYFDDYLQLLNLSEPREEKTVPASSVTIIFGEEDQITEMQNELLNCYFKSPESQIHLFHLIFMLITGWYHSPFWIQKDKCIDYSKLAPPPELPPGYYIEDFSRVREIYLSQEAPVIGAVIEVAWSENLIGVRYKSDSDEMKLEPVGTVEKAWV